VNRKSTLSIPEQSRNCSASWISFVVPSRGGRSCQNHFGRLRSNSPGNTACTPSRTHCVWIIWG
jgi:hypothetical protein